MNAPWERHFIKGSRGYWHGREVWVACGQYPYTYIVGREKRQEKAQIRSEAQVLIVSTNATHSRSLAFVGLKDPCTSPCIQRPK